MPEPCAVGTLPGSERFHTPCSMFVACDVGTVTGVVILQMRELKHSGITWSKTQSYQLVSLGI